MCRSKPKIHRRTKRNAVGNGLRAVPFPTQPPCLVERYRCWMNPGTPIIWVRRKRYGTWAVPYARYWIAAGLFHLGEDDGGAAGEVQLEAQTAVLLHFGGVGFIVNSAEAAVGEIVG